MIRTDDDELVIQVIELAYKDARALAIANALYPAIDDDEKICRYCGGFWQKWSGSVLDGHAQCMVAPEFRRWLRKILFEHPAISYRDLARRLGVSSSVVYAWYRHASRPRRKRVDLRSDEV